MKYIPSVARQAATAAFVSLLIATLFLLAGYAFDW
ncbi:hypothetical protein Slin_4211 [Spirosoma linguale DSM 74]|uniref:Uncharacterized protein n=1 Tax=Spirosoma linguale (strain ATCC 33905 / DSM 74 / LMG 10896 / Claus 1) TaxID=504472 RepID=D2QKN0_SPILD|nr:hypothetical protein Slin_4211 [Spirosoma linguale DSM 74]